MSRNLSTIFKSPFGWLGLAVLCYLISLIFSTGISERGAFRKSYKQLQQYIISSQDEFKRRFSDSTDIEKLAAAFQDGNVEGSSSFPVFVYRKTPFSGNEMFFWSSHSCMPRPDFLNKENASWFEQLDNGYYLCMKHAVQKGEAGDSLLVIGMVPLQYQYFVTTGYLPDHFVHDDKASQLMIISEEETAYPVTDRENNVLFHISKLDRSLNKNLNFFGLLFISGTVILLLVFIYFFTAKTEKEKGFLPALILLTSLLFITRVLSYFFPFPADFRQFELFDPRYYGSTSIQKSMGDLLINAVFLCWIALFTWLRIHHYQQHQLTPDNKRRGNLLAVLIMVIHVFFTFYMAKTVYNLVADSNISFDVVNFFSLDYFSVTGFMVLVILAITYYVVSRIFLKIISSCFNAPFLFVYIVFAVTGLFYLSIRNDHPLLVFFIITLGWLIAYTWLQKQELAINKPGFTIGSNLFWIFLFSLSITAIITRANREKEWEIRKRIADRVDTQTDPYNEMQLSISFAYIDHSFLQENFHRFRDPEEAAYLRDSILRAGGYLSKYDSRFYVFDEKGKKLLADDRETLNTLSAVLRVQAKKTNTTGLYFYETAFDTYTFIFHREVMNEGGKLLGSFFIVSYPEKYATDALYPELFRQENEIILEASPVYSYAVYNKGILKSASAKRYSFATSIEPADMPASLYENRVRGDYSELWYRVSTDKIVIIAKLKDSVLGSITLFSYIFCTFLLLVVLMIFLSLLFKVVRGTTKRNQIIQWTIRNQVHSTIIFISILSFIIIGVATISFFIKRYNQNNREKLSRTMQIMVNEMENKLDKRLIFDDQLAIYDSVSNQDVVKLVNEVAEIHNVDVNVYDPQGNLHVSSQSLIYREGFLSRKMHPVAYQHLYYLREAQYIQEENLSELGYLSIYAPVRGNDGVTYAFLNIPYFLSQQELQQEISNFLVTIINLNAFIFLIAGVIALFITNRVTGSFSLISEKMKEVNLGKTNEEIYWNRNDEIGGLVKEYNKMVKKLEMSAAALARSEREGAWREMARQVAHEIKNPLTPMKLSIQYLQKSIDGNSDNVRELSANVAKTLVEQIDHLSKIAFDFSQFANIGNTNPELFNLNDVLRSMADLYKSNNRVEVIMEVATDPVMLYSDKTQMNRLFANLFQNAVEACDSNDTCTIRLHCRVLDNKVTVSVEDNGAGIPDEMHARIFMPNFTTKSSGSGLGLAICKGIVETAGGSIWFETNKGEGTTFYVELPLAG